MPKYSTIKRLLIIDLMRVLAIIMMVIFHFCYDLKYFDFVNWQVPNGEYWYQARNVIVALFLLCVGAGMQLAHKNKIQWLVFFRRLLAIILGAILVTLSSLWLFPNNWIYFGILHFIFLASIVCLLFINRPKLALLTGLSLIIVNFLGLIPTHKWFLSWQEVFNLPTRSEDLVTFTKWFGVVLIGMTLPYAKFFNQLENKLRIQFGNNYTLKKISNNSLTIYLIHQPILFTLFYVFIKLL